MTGAVSGGGAGRLPTAFSMLAIEAAVQRGAGGFAMPGRDVTCDQANRGGENGGIIGKAEYGHHVRNEIERQDEIGERAEQRGLDVARGLFVERAVIGRKQVFREGKL